MELMRQTIRFGLAASVCAQFRQVNGGSRGETNTTNRHEEIAKTCKVGLDFTELADRNLIKYINVNDQAIKIFSS